MGRVEGKAFVTRSGDAAEFVVFEMRRTASLVGAVRQVAGSVIAVAAADGGLTRRDFILACTFRFGQGFQLRDLFFQTAYGVEFVAAGEFALCSADFAVQFVAFDVGCGA